ncbi:MAG: serine hydrolase domain-containing protein [Phycisphaerae bacterium]
MKTIRRITQLAGAVLFVSFAVAQKPGEKHTTTAGVPAAPASLDELLTPIREQYKTPALAAAVTRGGGMLAIGAVGVRRAGENEPVSVGDCFHIGSCTKAMTATLCARLVDEGNLRWDTTLGESFADLRNDVRPEYLNVTLEQLLQHRSGLPDDRQPGASFMEIAALSGEMRARRHELVRIALDQTPTDKPGKKMNYSNFGYAIAGAMCEQAADATWEDLIRAKLFVPLGMKSAGFGAPGDAERVDQPFGHTARPGAEPTPVPPGPAGDNPAVIGPGGTVHCSIGDWARFAAFHLRADGRELGLKPETMKRLHADVSKLEYAMGWGLGPKQWHGEPVFQHAGSNSMWFAMIQLSPKRDLAIVVATNCGTAEAQKACRETAEKLVARFDP